MSIVALPEDLSTLSDLEELNRQVLAGSVELDWSAVRLVSPLDLARLLAGCSLVDHYDPLGVGTMPTDISDQVMRAVLEGQPLADAIEEQFGDYAPEDALGQQPLLQAPAPAQIRQELQDLIVKDLLGPAEGPEEEVLDGRVTDRYLVGLLAPSGQPMREEADDDVAVAGVEGEEDGPVETDDPGPDSMFPSSLGLTFLAASETRALRLTARWGQYARAASETHTTSSGSPARVWKRIPWEGVCERLELSSGPEIVWNPCPDAPDVVVRGVARNCPEGWIVTLFLVNERPPLRQLKDSAWLFQPELMVEDADGQPVFLHRTSGREPLALDNTTIEEERSMEMLYRRHRQFAVGHGVAVHADLPEGRSDRALRLSTRIVPQYDVPATEMPNEREVPELKDLVLDMRALAEMETSAILANLDLLAESYGRWIGKQWKRIRDRDEGIGELSPAADAALSACEDAQVRIAAGIDLLRRDEKALAAFRFLNRAMWRQRIHTLFAQAKRAGREPDLGEIDVSSNRSWRLFQLAFILLNLPGLTELDHPDRSDDPGATADLLWFPTGGGKTEAYLGLTAYTLGIRRLQGEVGGRSGEHGVAVLMRYTLRLLTLQQFQRAATLICACETIRQEAWFDGDTRWGAEPFRLGLWVGHRTTPNTTSASAEAVRQLKGQRTKGSAGAPGSPAQLTHCPWCGSRIDPGRDIVVDEGPSGWGRTFIYCGDPLGQCPFTQRKSPDEGLPMLVVDEEIYHRLPALLISTVDKFAQMPWRGETQMLFGQVDAVCERHGFHSPDMEKEGNHPARRNLPRAQTLPARPVRPPDLIIQDELHLISGPLGSLVGLYETAIDTLASWQVGGRSVRPKVIASTATIRRAEDQVRGLFVRSVNVFPPHGIDVEDNYFSRQRPPEEVPGRRYIGVYAPGRRLKAALIRVYVAHLAAAQVLFEKYGVAADPWMTLVGYFNSMRELGGTRRLVDDDIRSRLRRTEDHGLANRRFAAVEELTSRKGSTEIPYVLERLERRFDPEEQVERQARKRRGARGTSFSAPIDVLLATNMLSVGVDVQRLGLMLVAGQPKTTAEYIQATSRVGRSPQGPGLVCTIYNWTRPRDLSHYERFEHYHATFYQQVEALSVTPFAPRARDRALTALLVSLVRLSGLELNENLRAGAISLAHPRVQEAIDAIVRRSACIGEHADTPDAVRWELEDRLATWLREAQRTEGGRRLGYKSRQDGLTVGLLQPPEADHWGKFTCLQSLRDVEPEISLVLDDRGLDDEPVPLEMGTWSPSEEVEA